MAETPQQGELSEALEQQAHGQHGDVFPPFDQTHFASQILWLAISFGLLYYLVSKVALPRVAGILEDRHDRIAWDLSEAERLKQESDDAVAAYEKALAEARDKAHAIARESHSRISAEVAAKRHDVEAGLAAKLATAEQRIGTIKADALAQVGDIASEATGAIVSTLVETEVSKDEIDGAVSAALAR
ncbi:F0F1 ATP synthase subunit B [Methylobrevis pamukkalensis]|uniref:ATP synthase subunit b n=1 Tax=Methylobrevis pamukkalensis TaxID=1439726 RepID=A0A1E3GZF1_9HYPH|nr:F0F1 ATP synthase subunit B [Methylobrevis pamukkalensis]ODN69447.1 ATP synthase subunit b 2 [Methylobrevis pamukkalensis]